MLKGINYKIFISFWLSLILTVTVWASSNEEENPQQEEFNATDVIMHHISDAHEWHILDYTKNGKKHTVNLPLPVILYADGHIDIFMSSAFHHGEKTIIRDDREYILYHGKIYLAENGVLNFDKEHHPTNVTPLDFSITKNVAAMMFSALLILLIFVPMARKYKKDNGIPRGFQSLLEPVVLFVRDDIAIPNIGKERYQRYMPYLLTAFFFIWINNILGLVPFMPGGANVTGNIAVTMVLAVFTLLITNSNANKEYWKHIFATPGIPFWLYPIMIPVELISVIAKPFALMIRLFANITAGHIIVLSLVSLIFIFKSIFISPVSVAFVLFMDVLELLVATLQAYIFTLLSALFIGLAVKEEH